MQIFFFIVKAILLATLEVEAYQATFVNIRSSLVDLVLHIKRIILGEFKWVSPYRRSQRLLGDVKLHLITGIQMEVENKSSKEVQFTVQW